MKGILILHWNEIHHFNKMQNIESTVEKHRHNLIPVALQSFSFR